MRIRNRIRTNKARPCPGTCVYHVDPFAWLGVRRMQPPSLFCEVSIPERRGIVKEKLSEISLFPPRAGRAGSPSVPAGRHSAGAPSPSVPANGSGAGLASAPRTAGAAAAGGCACAASGSAAGKAARLFMPRSPTPYAPYTMVVMRMTAPSAMVIELTPCMDSTRVCPAYCTLVAPS